MKGSGFGRGICGDDMRVPEFSQRGLSTFTVEGRGCYTRSRYHDLGHPHNRSYLEAGTYNLLLSPRGPQVSPITVPRTFRFGNFRFFAVLWLRLDIPRPSNISSLRNMP